MKKSTQSKTYYFKCECAEPKDCGYAGIVSFGDSFEIFWTKDKKKRGNVGVYIEKPKTIAMFKKMLSQ